MSDLLKRISSLSPEKKALFKSRLREQTLIISKKKYKITRRISEQGIPLSYSQERLFFLDTLAPGNCANNRLSALSMRGPLNIFALENSISKIISRHEILRTSFHLYDNQPYQSIRAKLEIVLPIIDRQSLPEKKWQEETQNIACEEVGRAFDIAQDPIIRTRLIRFSAQDHVLLLCVHHIGIDAWSIQQFHHELSILYECYCLNTPSPLAELPVQYADYAVWQRQHMTEETLESQLSYWEKQLDNLSLLQLPTDRPRPSRQSFSGASLNLCIPGSTTRALRAFAQSEGVTLFMTLLAAFQVLLHRYAQQDDIVVGTPIAGRTQAEIEDLIGFFVNSLVLRADTSGNPDFRTFLARVRNVCLEAYANQDVPFEKVVDRLQPSRDLSRNPLFQVMFNFENIPKKISEFHSLEVIELDVDSGIAPLDLTVEVIEKDGGLFCLFNYNTILFNALTIERMAEHFKILLKAIVAGPEQRVSNLSLLSEGEKHKLLATWNNTQADYPDNQCIHELFEAQAERAPGAIALVFGNSQLSYGELNRRANQLAHWLIYTYEVMPDTLIALCLERNEHMLIGILAVLKAGGAYVPMDPNYPDDRLSFIIEDTRTPVVLTNQSQELRLKNLHAQKNVNVVSIDSELIDTQLLSQSVERPVTKVCSTDLAYVIYTSGTTGKPKGVLQPHSNVMRLFTATENWFQFDHTDIWVLFHSYVFDFSVWEIWGALFHGGKLIIPDKEQQKDFVALYELCKRHHVTVLNQTPLAFYQFSNIAIHKSKADKLLRLRCVVFGGETLNLNQLEPWYECYGDQVKLINMYGITETTVHVTYKLLSRKDVGAISYIGRAIPDLTTYVLDTYQNLLPVGVIGELYVGGNGLARGYLNEPGLTAEKFVSNPFQTEKDRQRGRNGLLYKTGDLVHRLADGELVYIGRNDFQVKIRGFRIELGEIEACLMQHELVRESIVTVREDNPGDKRLVAYVVLAENAGDAWIEVLRKHMKELLPEYMIPSSFTRLEKLPLTPNGKVDRKALPKPNYVDESIGEAPRTETEQSLAELWKELLSVDSIAAEANFFQLGGHSLLLMRLVSHIRDLFAQEIPLQSMFEHPTLREQAHLIDQSRRRVALPPIAHVEEQERLELSFAQQRLWFLDRLEGEPSATYNIPFSLRLRGDLNVGALQLALSYLVKRHDSLRMVFRMEDGEPRIRLLDPYDPLTIIDLSVGDGRRREAQALARQHASTLFNLSEGPLFRIKLVRLAEDEHLLLAVIHHIISDVWSQGILNRELSEAYEAYHDGHEPGMPSLPVQYQDYAHWQRQWLSGDIIQTQLEYWQSHLAGAPSLLELPTDYPRPVQQRYKGNAISFKLPEALTAQMKQLTQQHGATLFMSLLAVFNLLLSRYSRQKDIVVGTPIAGRSHSQIDGLIGFFVNTLALRTQIRPEESFAALLSRVKEATLKSYSHQDIPFELLVHELKPERSLSYSPLFQVMFAFQNASMDMLSLPGLVVEPVAQTHETAKFDLTLSMEEISGELCGSIEYASNLFERATIERMVQHFELLLQNIIANPEQAVSGYTMLTEQEERNLLVDWNDTQADCPGNQCVHELFEAQAERAPGAIALVFGNSQLSYGELNRRANQLAHWLIYTYEVMPDTLIALCLERNEHMLIGILAVLKAGGAYVPMDPNYPDDRLSFIIEDTRTPVVLTNQSQELRLKNLHAQKNVNVVSIDSELIDTQLLSQSVERPVTKVCSTDLAYVIYTSGTTGKPKGVLQPHSNVMRLFTATENWFQFDHTDIWVLFHSYVFDFSVWEIWGALFHGGKLIIPDKEQQKDFVALYELCKRHHVTVLNQTPLAFYQFSNIAIHKSKADKLLRLRCVVFGGETLNLNQLEPWYECYGDQVKLINMYGITETTVHVTYKLLSRKDVGAISYIGRAIPDLTTYVLDTYQNLLPVGVIGELYVGGNGLARGYLNEPGLTAEKFVSNPFQTEKDRQRGRNGLLYKTGDLVHRLADGELVYIGRNDFQVKIRGFRIELGEIEACLMQHELVRESIVTVREDNPGDKRLVAYVVLAENAGDAWIEVLRKHMKELLPEYMIPSSFTRLEKLPLTPNGKVDRKALPKPNLSGMSSRQLHTRPLDMLEKKIAAIWGELLGVEPVGIDDNFFDLGGSSLSLIMLCERLEKQFNQPFVISVVYANPTLEALAGIVKSHDSTMEGNESERSTSGASVKGLEGSNHAFFTVRESGQKAPLFWMCGGRMLELIKDNIDDRPAYVFDYLGSSKYAQYKSIPEIVACYLFELKKVKPHGPYMIGGYSYGGLLAFEVANQLCQSGDEVKMLFLLAPTIPRSQTKGSPGATNLQKIQKIWLRHWQRLSKMNYYERCRYFPQKIIEETPKKILFPLVRRAGLLFLLPRKMRWTYLIQHQYKRSISEYHPGIYSGDMTVVGERRAIDKVERYWKPHCSGNTTVIEIDCAHHDFWKNRGVEEEWMKHLMASLESCA